MSNPFINKLCGYGPLSPDDLSWLEDACATPRIFSARHDLIREGDRPGSVFVLLDGWACRYKLLPEGGRQIIAFMMPGDCCDMRVSLLDEMDHSLATITSARVAMITSTQIEMLLLSRPAITRALMWSQLVDEAIMRAWIVSIGRRGSVERLAHLMCELYIRARDIGLAKDNNIRLPLTQIVLGDALGLTAVHVNRVLRQLKTERVMDIKGGTLTITNPDKLADIAGFDGNYLHRRLSSMILRSTSVSSVAGGRPADRN